MTMNFEKRESEVSLSDLAILIADCIRIANRRTTIGLHRQVVIDLLRTAAEVVQEARTQGDR